MRRTDLSRKIGRVTKAIEQGILSGEAFDLKSVVSLVKSEFDLRCDKEIITDNYKIVNFKDDNFEGVLKKADIYAYDSEAKNLGVKDIKNICGIVQVKYSNDRVELNLIVEAEYTDNEGKKYKVFPMVKSENILLINNTKEISTDDDKKEINNNEDQENDIIDNMTNEGEKDISLIEDEGKNTTYKNYIEEAIKDIFSKRFFGSAPSDDLVKIIIDKIHNIYVVSYLEQIYTNDSVKDELGEGTQVIKRILDML